LRFGVTAALFLEYHRRRRVREVLVRRVVLSLVLLCVAVFSAAPPGKAQQIDADIAKALVGKWEWAETSSGVTVNYQLILGGDGTFGFTSAMQSYQVTSTGTWVYEGGWLQFKTLWSSSLDSTGQPVAVGPIQILEVGPDYVRTPAGIARRSP
jgi:hypothetical protein